MARKTSPPKESLPPSLPPKRALEILTKLVEQAGFLEHEPFGSPKRSEWTHTAQGALERAFGADNSILQSFGAAQACVLGPDDSDEVLRATANSMLSSMVAVLRSGIQQLQWEVGGTAAEPGASESRVAKEIHIVGMICRRFHLVARQLTRRHDKRETLEVHDEYDVQDLLHALLRLHFEDVRPEEWTPSYAGGSARMDFLLKNEMIVIEAKMTRAGLNEKQASEQLIVDIARYRSHPDCKRLVCFVYDPEAHIRNPRGVEADLERMSSAGLEVTAIIAP